MIINNIIQNVLKQNDKDAKLNMYPHIVKINNF